MYPSYFGFAKIGSKFMSLVLWLLVNHQLLDQSFYFHIECILFLFFLQAMNPTDMIATHITGLISHGHHQFVTFLDMKEYKHDSNMVMNLLLKTMFKISGDMVIM